MQKTSPPRLLRPSNFKKVMLCPASFNDEHIPDGESHPVAIIGNFLHKMMEDYVQGIFNINNFEFDPNIISRSEILEKFDAIVNVYEYIVRIINPDKIFTEQFLEICEFNNIRIAGTADLVFLVGTELYVLDYKTGFVKVDSSDNEQLLLYSYGAYKKYKDDYEITKLHNIIIAPNMYYRTGYNMDSYDIKYLQSFIVNHVKGLLEELPSNKTVTGDHCKHCKLFWTCSAVGKMIKSYL